MNQVWIAGKPHLTNMVLSGKLVGLPQQLDILLRTNFLELPQ
jgi:hypothetical protein